MCNSFAGARSLLALGLFATVSPASVATPCNAAMLERLVNPLVVTKAETYEATIRRSLTSTNRADALLLKDALRRALVKDPSQIIELREVTYTPVVACEGYRIVGLSVRKDNVNILSAPAPIPASTNTSNAADPVASLSGPELVRAAEDVDNRIPGLNSLELKPRVLSPRELLTIQLPNP